MGLTCGPRGECNSKPQSPSKSPVKTVIGKASKTRPSRRSSSGLGFGARLELLFEAEVVVSARNAGIGESPSKAISQLLLLRLFVLPAPSPHSLLPRAPVPLSSAVHAVPAPILAESSLTLEDSLPSDAPTAIRSDPAIITPPNSG